jgi:hypothetical protein
VGAGRFAGLLAGFEITWRYYRSRAQSAKLDTKCVTRKRNETEEQKSYRAARDHPQNANKLADGRTAKSRINRSPDHSSYESYH